MQPESLDDPFARYRDLLPAGAVPVAMAGTIEYLDPSADSDELSYLVLHAGDLPLSSFLGLLELGKAYLMDTFLGRGE